MNKKKTPHTLCRKCLELFQNHAHVEHWECYYLIQSQGCPDVKEPKDKRFKGPECLVKEKGFGLIEVMVSAAIFSIMSLALASLMIYSSREVTSIQKRVTYSELEGFVSKITGNLSLCNTNFTGKLAPAVGASVPTLNFAGMQFDDSLNNFYNQSITISSLKYSAVTVTALSTQAVITLVANLQPPGGTDVVIGGNTPRPASFPVLFNVAGGVILNCL